MSQALIDDAIWARLEPLIPKRRVRRGHRHGRTPIPDRAILTGILFVLRSGIPWQNVAAPDGLRIGQHLLAPPRALAARRGVATAPRGLARRTPPSRPVGPAVDDHRQRLRPRRARGKKTGPNPTDRRKKGSTHHLIVDARGVPLVAQVTAANVNDITQLDPLVNALPAVRGRRGRPRRRPGALQGDRGYDSQPHRDRLWASGIVPVLAKRRTPHGSGLGVCRWMVERTIAWLHRFRRLTVRYERRADVHQAFLTLGCVLICWNYLKAKKRVF